ncbi:MAG: transporter [Gemmatimonadota bacterium]
MAQLMRATWILPMVLFAATAAAQSPDVITTDRPDFTESSTLVPRGRVQLEAGITTTAASRNSGMGQSVTWPELLLRYGLSSRIELRVAQTLTSVSPPAGFGTRYTGANDLYLGVKLGLGAQQGSRPELAAMLQATVPTGAESVTQNSTLPGAALLAGWTLSPVWSLAMGLQVNRVTGDAWEIAPSVTIGRALTSRLKAYGEYYAFIPALSESGASTAHYLNGGLALLLSDNMQLDARVGAGLGGVADRSYLGVGFAIRP